MVFSYKMAVASEFISAVRDRPQCYWGINCRTMDHNADHARRYNHILYQTRFWWFLYFINQRIFSKYSVFANLYFGYSAIKIWSKITFKKINHFLNFPRIFTKNQWFFPYWGFLNYLEVSNPFWKYKSIGGGVGNFFGIES